MSSAESIASEAIENFISAEQWNNMPSEEPMTPPTCHEGCMSIPQPQTGYIDGEALSNRLDNPVPIMYQPTLPKNGDSLSDILNKYPAPIEFQQYLESIDDRSHIIGLFMNVVYGPVVDLRHCVYCHQTYNEAYNHGCKIPHLGILESIPSPGGELINSTNQWTCCLRLASIKHFAGAYCYEGRHHDRWLKFNCHCVAIHEGKSLGWWNFVGNRLKEDAECMETTVCKMNECMQKTSGVGMGRLESL